MSNICEEHNFKILYCCTTPYCPKSTFICPLCIKDNHQNCKNEFFVDLDKLKDKVKFEWDDKRSEELYSKLEKYLDQQIEAVNTFLVNRKKVLLTELRRKDAFDEGNDFWRFIKENSKISMDTDTSTICVKSKLDMFPEGIDLKVKIFEKELQNYIETFQTGISKVRFGRCIVFNLDDWIGTQTITATFSNNKISLTVGPNFSNAIYVCKFWKIPKAYIKLLVRIDSINPNSRTLYFGVASKTNFPEAHSSYNLDTSKVECLYQGYSNMKMKGSMLTTDSADASGFHSGLQFFIELCPGKQVKMYTEDKQLDLISNDVLKLDDEYFLLVCLYFSQNSCSISVAELFE